MAAGDLYDVLGLEPGASPEQVERAYRFSLDLYGEGSLATYSLLDPAEAEAERARIQEAYQTLKDPERRRAYDEGRGYSPPEAPPVATPGPVRAGEAPAALPSVLTGADLRRMREAQGVSLRHIANASKIGIRFLEYIEGDRFAFLPASVYLRGFLQEYARILGLDPPGIAEAYMKRLPKGS
jgi:flagellar biosynthesis protein FlhG